LSRIIVAYTIPFFQRNKNLRGGLGTWQLGNADWGVVKDNEAFSILETFADSR